MLPSAPIAGAVFPTTPTASDHFLVPSELIAYRLPSLAALRTVALHESQ